MSLQKVYTSCENLQKEKASGVLVTMFSSFYGELNVLSVENKYCGLVMSTTKQITPIFVAKCGSSIDRCDKFVFCCQCPNLGQSTKWRSLTLKSVTRVALFTQVPEALLILSTWPAKWLVEQCHLSVCVCLQFLHLWTVLSVFFEAKSIYTSSSDFSSPTDYRFCI